MSIYFERNFSIEELGYNSFPKLKNLSFKDFHGEFMSSERHGIIFVEKYLSNFEIEDNMEFIYSYAFWMSKITYIMIPKSMKIICKKAFYQSSLETIEFEKGTELDLIDDKAFYNDNIKNIELPNVTEKLGANLFNDIESI